MAVGNSRPLDRSSATLSYLHLSFHETFDIIFGCERGVLRTGRAKGRGGFLPRPS